MSGDLTGLGLLALLYFGLAAFLGTTLHLLIRWRTAFLIAAALFLLWAALPFAFALDPS